MITSSLVTPDNRATKPFVTGYQSMQEAVKSLRHDYPLVTLTTFNKCVIAATDGCRLVLKEVIQ